MTDATLQDFTVAVLATDGFEQVELTEPVEALRKAGATVHVVSPKSGKIQGFHHFDKADEFPVDRHIDNVQPGEYDAVFLPGGAHNADHLRVVDRAQFFVRVMQDAGKPIAVICHGPWLLVSADLVRDRKMTSYHTLHDDIENAGGQWVDEPVVVDKNWVSSRRPSDLDAFNREMIRLFSDYKSKRGRRAA